MLPKKQIELTIPTLDLSLLRKIKGGYDPDGFYDKYYDGNVYNHDNYDSDSDSFNLGELEGCVCRPTEPIIEVVPDEELPEREDPEPNPEREDPEPNDVQDGPDEEHEGERQQDAGGGDTQYDLTAALEHLRNNAYDHYSVELCRHCARAVRMALEAGGLDTSGRPGYAGDYDNFLPTIGFSQVEYGPGYIPQPGDIVVHESVSSQRPEGHIAMYDGDNWISDYYQSDMFGGQAYRVNQDFTIWRYNR